MLFVVLRQGRIEVSFLLSSVAGHNEESSVSTGSCVTYSSKSGNSLLRLIDSWIQTGLTMLLPFLIWALTLGAVC